MKSNIKNNKSRKNTRNVKNLKGGRYLGQGSYGCIFHPNLPCDDFPTNPNSVSKIIENRSLTEEWTLINDLYRLNSIDNRGDYLIFPNKKCDITSIKPDDQLTRCSIIARAPGGKTPENINRSFQHIIMPYGDNDLWNLRSSQRRNGRLPHIESQWTQHLNVLKAVYLLNTNNLVHRDIKGPNIVMHNEKLKLIDFGLTTKINVDDDVRSYVTSLPPRNRPSSQLFLDDAWNGYSGSYYEYWPLDYMYIFRDILPKGRNTVESKMTYILNYICQGIYTSYRDHWFRPAYDKVLNDSHQELMIREGLQFLTDYYINNKWTRDQAKERVKRTLDTFSLGIVLSHELNDLPSLNYPYHSDLSDLVLKMTSQNPFKRPLIKDVIIEFMGNVSRNIASRGPRSTGIYEREKADLNKMGINF